jgi:glyoxylase-like metal-dependent hydrolase (beta-lactamase superfamily II)
MNNGSATVQGLPSATRLGTKTEVTPTLTHFQGVTWKCNCIVIKRGDAAMVIDACWNHRDIERVRDSVSGLDQHVLITHADIDHICGVGFFPDAAVAMGARSAARVNDGSAARDLSDEAEKWGLALPADLRVDEILPAGAEAQLGSFTVATVATHGHAVDGLGYVIEDEGLFAVGDYLMQSQMPMVWWSFTEARKSTERLLEALDRFDLQLIVPGHGPLLSVEDARRIGAEDLAYMEEVDRVADQAKREGVTPREWLLAVERVPVPRPAEPDIAMLCPNLLNAAATFRDRDVDGRLTWQLSMA